MSTQRRGVPQSDLNTPRRRSRRISGLPPELEGFPTELLKPTQSVRRSRSKPKRAQTTVEAPKEPRSVRRPKRRLSDLENKKQSSTAKKPPRKTSSRTPAKKTRTPAKTTVSAKKTPARSRSKGSKKKPATNATRKSARIAKNDSEEGETTTKKIETTNVSGEPVTVSAATIAALGVDPPSGKIKAGKEEVSPKEQEKEVLAPQETELISDESEPDSPSDRYVAGGVVDSGIAAAAVTQFRGTPFPGTESSNDKMTRQDWNALTSLAAIVVLYAVTLSRACKWKWIPDAWMPDWLVLTGSSDPLTIVVISTCIFALAAYCTYPWCNALVGDKLGLKIGSMEGRQLSIAAANNLTAERSFFVLHIVQSVLTLSMCASCWYNNRAQAHPDTTDAEHILQSLLHMTLGFYVSQLLMSFTFQTVISVGTVRAIMIIAIGMALHSKDPKLAMDCMVALAVQSILSVVLSRFVRIGSNPWLLIDQTICAFAVAIGACRIPYLSFTHLLFPFENTTW